MLKTPAYKHVDIVASREVWRQNAKASRSTFKIDFNKIKILANWNTRIFFDGIEELAGDIAENGQLEPLRGDMSQDGSTFFVTDGERRYRAIKFLRSQGNEDFEFVEVLPNPSNMKPVDKIFMMISTGVQKSVYQPVEIANGLHRIKTDFQLSNEAIGKRLGRSRQWVDDMIKLAKAPEEVKSAVAEGKTTRTAVVVASRTKSSDEMAGIVKSATSGGNKMRVKDAAAGGKSKDALEEVNFDKEQNDQEKQINKISKCLNKMEGLSSGLNDQAQKDFNVQLKIARDQILELKNFYSKKKNKEVPV